MPDRVRERLTLIAALASLAGTAYLLIAAVSGKLGVVVMGPPDLIAQVKTADSLGRVQVDSTFAARTADAARTHTRMDSVDREHDRRLSTLELLASQQMALSCVNTKPRDLVLTRIPCDQYVGRWRAPGGTP